MPIRVLHLIKSLGRGGAEMLLPEGLKFADRERFDYHYAYFLPWKDAMVGAISEQDAPVTCFVANNPVQIMLRISQVLTYVREHSIDLIHCHMPVAGAVGRIIHARTGVPVVYSEHNLQERFHPATRLLNRATWKWQNHVIAVSGDVAQSIDKSHGSRVPVQVVLNGVDVSRFKRNGRAAQFRHDLGVDKDTPVIGTVAVFRTQKRLLDWLEAARLIRESIPSARFFLVGDGPLRDEVEKGIRDLGLEEAVTLPGLKEDVRPYLSTFDIYMMSSMFEGLPVALLEAMSFECAPVCTAVGGIPELITDSGNGRLVQPGRPRDLAAAVVDVLTTPGTRDQLARAARETVVDGFSMQRMTREIEQIYDNVLDA